MGEAIGNLIPYALGIATSPIAIIAVILMLLSKRGGANSASFLGGWMLGVVGASVVLLSLSRTIRNGTSGVAARACRATNPASRSAASAPRPSVCAEPHA